ncbi:virulence RhuM family protein [Campylobacter sp. RM12651]|uniref:virulence RhuM family protein n=1 Tax=Campylobacter sp. RM12651 TaxID=1660079 RepID=UPI001EFBA0C1|nr:virulence RhuM family protein [Campylobacter sp. RM12651]ULO02613.1 RhuM family protein [Campylobacter sp. RM12651]
MNDLQTILYHIKDSDFQISVVIKDETIWATQKAIAELFGVNPPAISKHFKNIFESNELDEKVVISKMETTTKHGAISDKTQTKLTNFYNLDAIISVGYRINSIKATQFRIWTNNVLKSYIIKGFAINEEQLKQSNQIFGKDYFKELLDTIRSIRASERRIWQQITDIFAECSIDYDKNAEITKYFYALVQNKFHYAITGQTAAEIIYNKADSTKEYMGLSTWKNAPNGRILKLDTKVAKNYLSEKEIKQLERAVSGYFDYIEDLVERENTFTMEDFVASIDEFLNFRKYKILKDNGKISHQTAIQKAQTEYDIFNKTQKIQSDFDKSIAKLTRKKS